MIIKKRTHDYIKVKDGQTLMSICSDYDLEIEVIKKINNITSEVVKNDIIFLKEPSQNYYIVRPLDTLEKISTQFNISVEKLIYINKLVNKTVFVGQKIMLNDDF